ncbi:hypothetical protein NMY22_g9046 [Coprinellus aureogranulatus]|nr:hypothetical protein NMY22_g9046 [Coprinellus aureogranulatus]
MPRGTASLHQRLSWARQGDLAALKDLQKSVKVENVTPTMVDIVFEGLTAKPVPAIRDPRTNMALVALAGTRPALSLDLFWRIAGTNIAARPDTKDALIRNITEHGNMFFRWSAFCLRCNQPCFPDDMFQNPNDSVVRPKRYLLQARLLLKLLDIDTSLSLCILTCDDFLDLFLQLWNEGVSLPDPLERVSRVMDTTDEYACPIVQLAQKIMADDASKEAFLQQLETKKCSVKFSDATLDRVNSPDEGRTYNMAGWMETLMGILEVAEILWSSSEKCRRRLHGLAFLMHFSHAWNDVTTTLVKKAGHRSDFLILLQPITGLMVMAFNGRSHSTIRRNWQWLNMGEFWGTLFEALASVCKDEATWGPAAPVAYMTRALLAHPMLIPYPTCADGSIVKPSFDEVDVQRWRGYASAFEMAQDAKAAVERRLPAERYLCDNPACTRPTASTKEEHAKECRGCSSVAYCSIECQVADWKTMHKNECERARKYYDGLSSATHFKLGRLADGMNKATKEGGTLYGLKTRASQTALVEIAYARRTASDASSLSAISVLDFTAMHQGSVNGRSYEHHLSGAGAYWDRESTSPSSFGQSFLRPRLKSLMNAYTRGALPSGWRVAEGIFPSITGPKLVYLTVLLKPVDEGFRSVYCVARDYFASA